MYRGLRRTLGTAPRRKSWPLSTGEIRRMVGANETWQTDFTHYPLTDGTDVEILPWIDDCTRYAIRITAHRLWNSI